MLLSIEALFFEDDFRLSVAQQREPRIMRFGNEAQDIDRSVSCDPYLALILLTYFPLTYVPQPNFHTRQVLKSRTATGHWLDMERAYGVSIKA